jgi:hypothetical protein
MSYLAAAERTGQWLLSTAQRSPQGLFWPEQPGISVEVVPGVGWGTAGPTMFFVEAFRTTGDERWLLAAREGVRWMDANLGASAGEWAGCGLFTGVGGWAVVLHELGAPGIGSTLLRLHRHLAGNQWTVRWPHAPDWS